MRVSRRSFVTGLAGITLASAINGPIQERRLYEVGSLLPPPKVLKRNGVRVKSVSRTRRGAEYAMLFDSLEARCAAWDRFNSDPAWCALRGRGEVRLTEIALSPSG